VAGDNGRFGVQCWPSLVTSMRLLSGKSTTALPTVNTNCPELSAVSTG
jgi:hypothetical protein